MEGPQLATISVSSENLSVFDLDILKNFLEKGLRENFFLSTEIDTAKHIQARLANVISIAKKKFEQNMPVPNL